MNEEEEEVWDREIMYGKKFFLEREENTEKCVEFREKRERDRDRELY